MIGPMWDILTNPFQYLSVQKIYQLRNKFQLKQKPQRSNQGKRGRGRGRGRAAGPNKLGKNLTRFREWV